MKKQIIIPAIALTMCLGACGSQTNSEVTSVAQETTIKQEKGERSSKTSDDVSVDKGLFDVIITVPTDYVGATSQEELDEKAKEYGYKVKLNDDGSATYTMTKSQHKRMMDEMADSLNQSLQEMVGSEDYPNFTDIDANSDFTSFIITTKSSELGFDESISTLAFYMFGGIYNVFNGTEVDNIHVEFINADSGEVISSSDSKD